MIIDYLETHWSEREISDFFSKLEEGTEHVRRDPDMYKQSERRKDSREYQLAPQTTIFYDLDDTALTILLRWHNRMDPERLK